MIIEKNEKESYYEDGNDDLGLYSIKKDQRRDLFFIPRHLFYFFVIETSVRFLFYIPNN